jgi:hypothetical protein
LLAYLFWTFTALPRLLALVAARLSLAFRPFALRALGTLRPTTPRLLRLSFPWRFRPHNRLRNVRLDGRGGRNRLGLLQRRQA